MGDKLVGLLVEETTIVVGPLVITFIEVTDIVVEEDEQPEPGEEE